MLKIDFENQILALFDVYFWPFNKSHEKNQYHFCDQCNHSFNLKCFYQIPLTCWKTYTAELYQKDFGDVTVFSLLSESRLNIILDSRERPIFRVYFWPFERRFTLCRNKLLPDDFHLLIYSLLSRNMDIPGITLSYSKAFKDMASPVWKTFPVGF